MPLTDDANGNEKSNLSLISFLAALASAISIVEDTFFPVIPLPGVSFGLNNAVFLISIDRLKPGELLIAQMLKVVIAGLLFKGLNINYLAMSLSGALASTAVLLFYRKFMKQKGFSLVSASALSSSAHITVQISVSSVLLSSTAPFSYLPFSGAASVAAGAIVGAIANLARLKIR